MAGKKVSPVFNNYSMDSNDNNNITRLENIEIANTLQLETAQSHASPFPH